MTTGTGPSRQRALFVTPCTLKGYAGNIARFEQTVRLLSRDFDIDVLSLVERVDGQTASRLREWGVSSVDASLDVSIGSALLRTTYKGIYIFNRLMIERGRRRSYDFSPFDSLAPRIIQWSRPRSYDLLFVNYIWLARALASLARRTVVDLHDIHGNRHSRIGRADWVSLEPADETRRIREVAVAIAIASSECETLRQFDRSASTNVCFVPYWPPGPVLSPPAAQREPACVFVASANAINVAALERLESSGLLDVFRERGIETWLCGAICTTPQAGRLSARRSDVRRLGIVRHLDAVLQRARLGVNLAGPSTGLKIKTVDCLHAGLATIVSPSASDPWLDRLFGHRLLTLPDEKLDSFHREACMHFIDRALEFDSSEAALLASAQASTEVAAAWSDAIGVGGLKPPLAHCYP